MTWTNEEGANKIKEATHGSTVSQRQRRMGAGHIRGEVWAHAD
jgi:hypothetical protein